MLFQLKSQLAAFDEVNASLQAQMDTLNKSIDEVRIDSDQLGLAHKMSERVAATWNLFGATPMSGPAVNTPQPTAPTVSQPQSAAAHFSKPSVMPHQVDVSSDLDQDEQSSSDNDDDDLFMQAHRGQ